VKQQGTKLFYLENVSADWLEKSTKFLKKDDNDFIVAFNKRANESFSIAPYSGILPPSKRSEQKASPVATSTNQAKKPIKAVPDNIKKEIKTKCAAEFPSDYVQQAECVKRQEAGWLEMNR
jgi:hypothetical protein